MPAGSEPSASQPLPGLPVRFRPVGVVVAVVVFAVVLLGTVTVVWLAIPTRMQEGFTLWQRVTLLLILGAVLMLGHGLARCRVDADDTGITVVNGYRTHRFEWGQVVAVRLRPGNPWAVLDLNDGTTCSAVGIQGSDGARARRHARYLHDLVEAHAAPDPREPDGGSG